MKFFLRLAGLLAILLLLAVLVIVLAVGQSRRHLETFVVDLEKRGETLDVTRLAPPPPPEGNNGAKEFLRVAREIRNTINAENRKHFQITEEVSPGWNKIVHRQDTALVAKDPSPWSEVRKTFASLPPLLSDIRKHVRSPVFQMQPDYTAGLAMKIDGVSEGIVAGQMLSQEGILFLEQQTPGPAVENVETLLRLADMIHNQQGLIFQLVAASLLNLAHSLSWEILQSPEAGEPDLVRLQQAWNQARLADTIVAAWRMERAMAWIFFHEPTWSHFWATRTMARMISSGSGLPSPGFSLPQSWDELSSSFQYGLWSTFYRHADARQFLADFQTLIDTAPSDTASGPWLPALQAYQTLDHRLSNAGIERLISKSFYLTLHSSFSRMISTQALITMTQTAIALQRHRLATGRHPDALTDLVPVWLPSLPRDPFDAKPLRYQKRSDLEYLLYSVGPNGKDENGDPTIPGGSRRQGWILGNDLVWPRPTL